MAGSAIYHNVMVPDKDPNITKRGRRAVVWRREDLDAGGQSGFVRQMGHRMGAGNGVVPSPIFHSSYCTVLYRIVSYRIVLYCIASILSYSRT